MDGNRSLADGCDLLESRIRDSFQEPIGFGYTKLFFDAIISDYNCPTNHVGSEDETSQAREMGDGVRS